MSDTNTFQFYKNEFERLNYSLSAERQTHFDSFIANGWPKKNNENWRYANLKSLNGLDFQNYENPGEAELNLGINFETELFVFTNGFFDRKKSKLSSGVEAYLEVLDSPSNVMSSKSRSEIINSSFYFLNQAFSKETYKFTVPAGVSIEKPVVFSFVYSGLGPTMYHPNITIDCGKQSKSVFLNVHHDDSDGTNLIGPMTHIEVGEGAHCEFYKSIVSSSTENYLVSNLSIGLQKDSTAHVFSQCLGGKFNRLEAEAFHHGTGATLNIDGVFRASGKSQMEYYSRFFHEQGHGQTHQIYKGVLDGESVSSFDGVIDISMDAQKVDSSQLNKNLLLSNKAQANTKPQLNVMADDVKAAHGATVSQLDQEEVFYLTSRGIPGDQAQKMIELSFCNEVFLRIENLKVRNWLKSYFEKGTL